MTESSSGQARTGGGEASRSHRQLRAAYGELMFGEGTRGRLLRATAVAVSRHGTRSCTVQLILEEAGLSRRTFYKTFKSLEDALNALFEVSVAFLTTIVQQAVASADTPLERVMGAVDAYLDLQIVGGPLIIALQREAMHADSPLAAHRGRLIEEFARLLEQELGPLLSRPADPLLWRAAISMIEGLVAHLERDGTFTHEHRQRLRAVIADLLLRFVPGAAQA